VAVPRRESYKRYLDPEVISKLRSMDLRARLVVEGFIAGLHKSPYHGFSVEFAEHRQYMPGDEIKHVDWKVYGKTDRFYVKQFEEETNLKLYLLLDASASMGFGSRNLTKLQYASYLAAALTYLMLPPRSITSYLHVILKELETIQPSDRTDIGDTLHHIADRVKRRGLVVLFSDLLDDPNKVISGLKHFRHRKHEVIVFHILDPMELTFEFGSDAVFRDLETGEQIVTQPVHIRNEYRRHVQAFVDTYRRTCREDRIDYALLNTQEEFDRALFQYLLKRKRIGG
jgi:uncharacterized protein (DUF58 family)